MHEALAVAAAADRGEIQSPDAAIASAPVRDAEGGGGVSMT